MRGCFGVIIEAQPTAVTSMGHFRERTERAGGAERDERARSAPQRPERVGPTFEPRGAGLDGLGNRSLLALLRSGRFQARLRVSTAGDPREMEADRAAERVVAGERPERPRAAPDAAVVQRAPTEDEALASALGLGPTGSPGRAEPAESPQSPPPPEDNDAGARGLLGELHGGSGLDERTRSLMESRFGESFSQVRVHTGSRAEEAAEVVRARAFTVGEDIVFGRGQFAPGSAAGQHLLAHELAHVVQQRADTGVLAADDKGTEVEAREAALEVAEGNTATVQARARPGTVQRAGEDEAPWVQVVAWAAAPEGRGFCEVVAQRPDGGFKTVALVNGAGGADPVVRDVLANERGGDQDRQLRVGVFVEGEATAQAVNDGRHWKSIEVHVHKDVQPQPVPPKPEQPKPQPKPRPKPAPQPQPPPGPRPTPDEPPREVPKQDEPEKKPDDENPRKREKEKEPSSGDFAIKLGRLRRYMDEGRLDVDYYAAKLSNDEMRQLPLEDRKRLLNEVAGGAIVDDEDEDTILRLLDTTPDEDVPGLIDELRAFDARLTKRLLSVVDGEEYEKLHVSFRKLAQRGTTPEDFYKGLTQTPVLPFSYPKGLGGISKGHTTYRAELGDEGKVNYEFWESPPYMPFGLHFKPAPLDPFALVPIRFPTGETSMNAGTGQVVMAPAVNLLLLKREQSMRELENAGNVGLVASGVGGVAGATTRAAVALATMEVALGATNLAVSTQRDEIARTADGKKFLAALDAVNLLVAAYSVGKVVKSVPAAFRDLREAYRLYKLRGMSELPEGVATKFGSEVDELLSKSDDAQKALEEDLNADMRGRDPNAKGEYEIDGEPDLDMPLVPTGPAPAPAEIAGTIDEALGKSKAFKRWLAPRTGGPSARGRVTVMSDAEYVRWRAAQLTDKGIINPETGRAFTPQEAQQYARTSRGSVDPSGQIRMPTSDYEPGNAIHEGLHQRQSSAFKGLGRTISEGATEYFTMIITQEQGIPRDYLKYQQLRPVVFDMAKIAGFDNVAEAYFNGDIGKVKAAFESARPGLWDEWVGLCKKGKLEEARVLLEPFYEGRLGTTGTSLPK